MSVVVRCAIYTRKSTEEGLEQAFNSLDAQREACEAYVRSQAGEGWRALPTSYEDGGFTGGNLDRPSMQQLLRDIDAGIVDVIVVYKVDRLTRSLIDFAKIVERLDAKGVSFVSVTQAFNTTTSMGRLTLNVLLSFAQFEREVTGERIRDKIAASKAKGMWMGGNVPFGYDLGDRRLVINPLEADQVRNIFKRYLELGSLIPLQRELTQQGRKSKRWTSRSGKEHGGVPFNCGALSYLLRNRLYIGEVVHKGAAHTGEHEPIIDRELFEDVQLALASRRIERRSKPTRRSECYLVGRVFDAHGAAFTTSFSYGRSGRQYRYYVAGSLDPAKPCEVRPTRFPARPLEALIFDSVGQVTGRKNSWEAMRDVVRRVELHKRSIQVVLATESLLEPGESVEQLRAHLEPTADPDRLVFNVDELRIVIDRAPIFRGGKVRKSEPTDDYELAPRSLAHDLKHAHELLGQHLMSPIRPDAHAGANAPKWQSHRRKMTLGYWHPRCSAGSSTV